MFWKSRDNLAVQEVVKRLDFTQDIDQVVDGVSAEKRQLSSTYHDTHRRKRSATPQTRKY